MDLGNVLLNLRKKKGLSQEEVADKLNVSRQTVSKWETNQSTPDFDKILPLCNLYEISTDELLKGKLDETKEKVESNKNIDVQDITRKRAQYIGTGILLYFVAIAIFMVTIPALQLDPTIAIAIFLIICGIGTYSIVYANIVYKVKKTPQAEKESKVLRSTTRVITLISTCLYFIISFATTAWHITWIIWIVNVLVIQIAKLIFALKGAYDEK